MSLLTKIKQWFKVKYPSRQRGARRLEDKMGMPQDESHKGAALAFFMEKYRPRATVGSFRLVAKAELEGHGYPNVDVENLSPEQEQHLIRVFERVSLETMGEWIAGLLLSGYLAEEREKLKQKLEAAKARHKQEANSN